jgi:hypothetical protein
MEVKFLADLRACEPALTKCAEEIECEPQSAGPWNSRSQTQFAELRQILAKVSS